MPEPPVDPVSYLAIDEGPHDPGPELWWREAWSFDVWQPDGTGVCTSLTVLPGLARTWYWCAVVQPDRPLLHLADLEVPPVRPGLELRTGGLWASHVCEAPFAQWTVANEAYGVLLDDPAEALGRGHGVPAPVALDLEWYADELPTALPGGGYEQAGTVDGVVELATGPVELERAASLRRHEWGTLPKVVSAPGVLPEGVWVPFALDGPDGPEVLDRVLTPSGWWERRRAF